MASKRWFGSHALNESHDDSYTKTGHDINHQKQTLLRDQIQFSSW